MEAIQCIKERRSVRTFKTEKVSQEIVEKIIETARFAPSWKNTQTARYIVIENKEMKELLAEKAVLGFSHNAGIMKNAPQLVIITCVHGRSGFERDGSYSTHREGGWQLFDTGIATQTLCLSAYDHGISSVILGIFDDEKVASLLELPEDREAVVLVPMGYSSQTPVAPKRKSIDELLEFK